LVVALAASVLAWAVPTGAWAADRPFAVAVQTWGTQEATVGEDYLALKVLYQRFDVSPDRTVWKLLLGPKRTTALTTLKLSYAGNTLDLPLTPFAISRERSNGPDWNVVVSPLIPLTPSPHLQVGCELRTTSGRRDSALGVLSSFLASTRLPALAPLGSIAAEVSRESQSAASKAYELLGTPDLCLSGTAGVDLTSSKPDPLLGTPDLGLSGTAGVDLTSSKPDRLLVSFQPYILFYDPNDAPTPRTPEPTPQGGAASPPSPNSGQPQQLGASGLDLIAEALDVSATPATTGNLATLDRVKGLTSFVMVKVERYGPLFKSPAALTQGESSTPLGKELLARLRATERRIGAVDGNDETKDKEYRRLIGEDVQALQDWLTNGSVRYSGADVDYICQHWVYRLREGSLGDKVKDAVGAVVGARLGRAREPGSEGVQASQ
jgi:hypothetical protein